MVNDLHLVDAGRAPIRVAVLSRSGLTRAGLTHLLLQGGEDTSVVDLHTQAGRLAGVDVVVYDLAGLVGTTRSDLAILLAESIPVVALISGAGSDLADAALAMGVAHQVSMDVTSEELVQAVEHAIAGRTTNPVADRRGRRHSAHAIAHLTDRELAVLALVGAGLTNQDIAERLYLSINTVKTYIRSAYRKIGVSSRTEAVLWAVHHDLTPIVGRTQNLPQVSTA